MCTKRCVLYIYTMSCLSIHLSRELKLLPYLAIVNNAIMNSEVHVVSQICAFIFFGHTTSNGIAGSTCSCSFIFSGKSILFFTVTEPTYTPKKSVQGSLFSTSLPTFITYDFFDDRHSDM